MPCSLGFMIRVEEPERWILVRHQDHARLAGQFAEAWGNDEFAPPDFRAEVLTAVSRHDDAWSMRDLHPKIGRGGRPAAFSHELVGSYQAFEDIDLEEYLGVRAAATESVARDHPYAAILVSMHTLNLLTEQADLSRLSASDLALHRLFVTAQRQRQHALISYVSTELRQAERVTPLALDRAFRFLQACDSLSLAVCVRYPSTIPLRHRHATRDGAATLIECFPLGGDEYAIHPYPFSKRDLTFTVPCRRVPKIPYLNDAALRAAWAAAPEDKLTIRLVERAPQECANASSEARSA